MGTANEPNKSKRKRSRVLRWAGLLLIALTTVCLLAALVSAWTNARIPKSSEQPGALADDQKGLLAEAAHLRQALGNVVFPGFGDQYIPFVIYNEQYAFYTGAGLPPTGWVMFPRAERRGGEWEAVPGEDFFGAPYYRAPILHPDQTPESFIVQVGDQLAGSFQTREYGLISMAAMMRAELPPVVRSVVPYRLIAGQLLTQPGAYVAALLHETFHAFQAVQNPDIFAQSELLAHLEEDYPFDDEALQAAWDAELAVLSQAAQIETDEQARQLAASFLALRADRRRLPSLTPDLAEYERRREWLEGLAKYAELEIGRAAALSDYAPLPVAADAGLQDYADRDRFWRLQLESIDNTYFDGETLFYYSGFAQAVLLDHLSDNWKETVIVEGVALEDLLRQALEGE